MATIALLYFSGYGHTKKQAEAVRDGALSVAGTSVEMLQVGPDGNLSDADWETLADANAIIYGSPTYMGGPAWQMKKVADASSKPWFEQKWRDKIGAGFTNSASVNGDKYSTLMYFFTLAMQHGQIWVGTGELPRNASEHGPDDINWTAGYSGAMAISPSDAGPEVAPRKGDLETARLLGKRVAEKAG